MVHRACFNSETGDIEDLPAIESLVKYEVQESKGQIKVRARRSQLKESKRSSHVCEMINDTNKVVVIGGGAAGFSAVKTLREENFTRQITLISSEQLPYDRTQLSKRFQHGDIILKDQSWYDMTWLT